MQVLLIRLEAPLISFGAPIVDNMGTIQTWPALSMLVGLLGNALGYHHRDIRELQRLQERLRYACRQDRKGRRIQDYQTVDLGSPYLSDELGWTTRGQLERRAGGSSRETHIRQRDYWADAMYTIALTLVPENEKPTSKDLTHALEYPERPLFIGRKSCLPSSPLFAGELQADDLLDALLLDLPSDDVDLGKSMLAFWQEEGPKTSDGHSARPITDARDWTNQIHVGERWVGSGWISQETGEVHYE